MKEPSIHALRVLELPALPAMRGAATHGNTRGRRLLLRQHRTAVLQALSRHRDSARDVESLRTTVDQQRDDHPQAVRSGAHLSALGLPFSGTVE